MPVDRNDVEITKEFPSVLKKMERGKFYTFEELYKLEFGSEFDPGTTGELWAVEWSQWTSLNVLLTLLAEQSKIVTGASVNEQPRTVTVKGKKFAAPRTVYYGLPSRDD